jgi:hypothetical protein
LLNIARREQGVSVAITDRMAAWRRERRVLARVARAGWRLEQAERERCWALASARAEGVSIRKLAAAAGLCPARVHQITAGAGLDELDAALGVLRAAGWPAPEDPGGEDDAELDGRDLICDRLLDEVGWLRQCAGWLTHLHTMGSRRRSTCAPKAITLTGRTWWPTCPGWPRSCSGSPPTSMSWPAPAAWPTSARRPPFLTGGPDGGAG